MFLKLIVFLFLFCVTPSTAVTVGSFYFNTTTTVSVKCFTLGSQCWGTSGGPGAQIIISGGAPGNACKNNIDEFEFTLGSQTCAVNFPGTDNMDDNTGKQVIVAYGILINQLPNGSLCVEATQPATLDEGASVSAKTACPCY
mmetsp:Transcript_3369/g.4628  ORF Transcript_3369/g.4628 Transcript_3369/m.4628 type:complete len:142 (-) Transcript_3369:66-491(-)